jgi:hypothetical protein
VFALFALFALLALLARSDRATNAEAVLGRPGGTGPAAVQPPPLSTTPNRLSKDPTASARRPGRAVVDLLAPGSGTAAHGERDT